MSPTADIDVINKTVLICVFLIGFVLGSAITVFLNHLTEKRRDD